MPAPIRFLALPAALALAACSSAPPPPGPTTDGVDMRDGTIGGDFTLTGSKGQKVNWADFKGKYRMVYFGFTNCPAICPTDVLRMSQGLELFEKEHPELAAKVQPIFISIDPERDTPEKVGEFVGNFHPRLVGLTGSPEDIAAVAKAFGTSAQKESPDETGFYNVAHSTFVTLFGPDGEPLGILPTDKGPEGLARELEAWIR
ncbi:SCO family protein [Erythrobacter sp. SDW2]|uniref:SCO family protein n=1 Tax=Erythrobacter sp. SDW2 TaxID=2907154 RepID=UPI001F1D77C7|nr:SCO family protein [Erythrobacter sp. SDW2]UIP06707.1 SCO family protein [Erythrobacter sp. SDW2]